MSCFCFRGEFFCEWNDCSLRGVDVFSIRDLDAWSRCCGADAGAVFFGCSVKVVAGGTGVDDGFLVCLGGLSVFKR